MTGHKRGADLIPSFQIRGVPGNWNGCGRGLVGGFCRLLLDVIVGLAWAGQIWLRRGWIRRTNDVPLADGTGPAAGGEPRRASEE